MIIQNLAIQCSAVFLGIIAGIIVNWLAQEELLLYKSLFETITRFILALTLLLPLLFTQSWMPILFLIALYAVLGIWQQREIQLFFLLAPFSGFMVSNNNDAFFTVLAGIFIATLFSMTILFSAYTKEKKIQWQRKIMYDGLKIYIPYMVMSVAVYVLTFLLQNLP